MKIYSMDEYNTKDKKVYSMDEYNELYPRKEITKTPKAGLLKTTGKTILAGTNYLGQGVLKGVEGIGDTLLQVGSSKINPYYWFNPDKLKEHQAITKDIIKEDATKNLVNTLSGDKNFNQNVLDKDSLIKEENLGGAVAKSIGQMLPSIAIGSGMGAGTKLAENVGLGVMGAQSFGGGLEEAYNQGANRGQATAYALMDSAIETATEKMFAGIGGVLGKGALDDAIKTKLTKKMSNAVAKKLTEYGLDMVGEGVEELASDLLQPLAQKLTYANDKEIKKLYQDQNYLEDFVAGALSAGVMQGVRLPSEIRTAVKENATKEKAKLPGTRTEQSISNNIEELKQEQQATTDNKLKQEYATKISGLEQELNQFKLPMASTEGMSLQESASKYNIKPETQSNVQQLMDNRNIESRWDATKFKDNSVNALWTKDANGNRQVIFNPNASLDTIVEEVAVHELTHDILSSENTTLNPTEILDYVSQLDGYNEARQSLINTYKDMYDVNSAEFNSLIDEEVVADVLGRKLGNQEFINQLVNSKPSIAKSIYNWVVSKLNSIINNGKVRNEKLYWQNIKNNFENAYKQEYKNNEMASTKYKVSDINTDNQGRELSKQQQEFFKDSKVRDEDGNLMVMYHGTESNVGLPENERFTIFDRDRAGSHGSYYGSGFYFTPYSETAQDYAKSRGNVYETYLNMTNPYIPSADTINKDGSVTFAPTFYEDFENRFKEQLPQYWNDENTNKGRVVRNILQDNGYDGIINGDTYVVFESNQIKNVDNTNPTTNEDIRYSKENAEWNEFLDKNLKDTGTSGTLMALHSLSEDKLLSLLDLDGIPVPSLGITDANSSDVLDEFGGKNGVFLIFSKDTINPKNKLNEVYSRDIYSKIVPEIYQKVDKKTYNKVMSEFRPYESKYGTFNRDYSYNSSLDKIVNDLSYSSAAKAKFLEDNGYNFEKAYKNYKSQYGFTEDVINKFINEYPELASFNPNMVDNVNEINEIAPKIKEIAIDMMVESNPKFTKKQLTELFKDEWRLNDITQFYRDINNYRRLNGQKEFDIYETRDNIDKEVEKHKEEFENWLRNKFTDVYNEKYFEDESGRKKAYTLENLTSYMKKGKTTAQQKGLFNSYSIGQAKGDAARRFMSIEDIKNARDKLVDVETYKARHEAFENIDDSVRNEIGDTRINDGEDLFEVYSDYYRALGQTARGVDAETALKNNNYDNLSKEQIQKFKEVANTLSSLPAKYFEAKPQRAVGLNEIEVAVIPNNIKESTRKALRNKGIDFVEYDPNVEGDRNKVINKFDNLKFSKNSPEWDNFVNKHIVPEGTKTKLKDIKLPKKEINLPSTPKKQTILPMAREDNVLKVNANEIADFMNGVSRNQRGWAKTATESDALKGKVLIEDLDPQKINYVVQTNKSSLDKANNTIDTLGYDKSLDRVKQLINDEKLPSASDVALMQRMIQEAAKRGDVETVQDLIMDTAIVGTDLGQATQALSIIQKLTPEGQLKMYTKLVQRAKVRGENSFKDVEITPKMAKNILDAYKSDGTYDQQDLNNRVEQFKQEIANQMKTTTGEKVNAWRYLAMLGNPKTHIRNIVSNVAMNGTIKVKNAMARTLESVLPIANRTKTWKKATTEIQNYANKTANEMKGVITGEAKYNEKTTLEAKKQIFKNKTLEKISDFNSNALEAEDWFFSKMAFKNTLQEYLTANGINTLEDIKNNPEVVEKAKIYAIEQAEIATFRQYSKLASAVNSLEKNNKAARLFIEATMPFKKTPINVAKAGVKYSPLGLIKAISYDIYQVKQGNMEASQFIDNLSQGLTGTSLAMLGYALAKAGILNGAGGDDKDDKYDSQLGDNQYSLKIGDKSYSISWLSPVAMPLLVGANAYEQLEGKEEWDMNVVSDTLAKTLDPLNEMSFMQGLTNALTSYGSGVDKIKGSLESVAQNYVGQFFPTLFSQFASTIDDKKRSTKASANSTYKFGEQTLRSVMYKLPGLRQQLEVATDIWGNEKEQADNIIQRAYESFIAPYSTTKNITSNLDKEIKKVYNKTGETGVIPGIPYAYVKYGDETYRMSANEYTKYKKTYGTAANSTLNSLINSSSYKNASDEEKAKMIDNVYDYARAKANKEYFDSINVSYENKTLDKLNTLKSEFGVSPSTYYANKGEYDYAYTNPDKYKTIKQITSYDKYTQYKNKITEIKDNTTNDKQETIKYINSLNLNIPQKAMLIKQYYKSFTQYDSEIIKYINSQNLSKEDKQTILGQLGFVIRDGRVYSK